MQVKAEAVDLTAGLTLTGELQLFVWQHVFIINELGEFKQESEQILISLSKNLSVLIRQRRCAFLYKKFKINS